MTLQPLQKESAAGLGYNNTSEQCFLQCNTPEGKVFSIFLQSGLINEAGFLEPGSLSHLKWPITRTVRILTREDAGKTNLSNFLHINAVDCKKCKLDKLLSSLPELCDNEIIYLIDWLLKEVPVPASVPPFPIVDALKYHITAIEKIHKGAIEKIELIGEQVAYLLSRSYYPRVLNKLKSAISVTFSTNKLMSSIKEKPFSSNVLFHVPRAKHSELESITRIQKEFLSSLVPPNNSESYNTLNKLPIHEPMHFNNGVTNYCIASLGNDKNRLKITSMQKQARKYLFLRDDIRIPIGREFIELIYAYHKRFPTAPAAELYGIIQKDKGLNFTISPEGEYCNGWQAILDEATKLTHIVNPKTVDSMGFMLLMHKLSEGGYVCTQKDAFDIVKNNFITTLNRNESPLKKLLALIEKVTKYRRGDNPYALITNTFNICIALDSTLQPEQRDTLWKEIDLLIKINSDDNHPYPNGSHAFFEILMSLINDPSLPFDATNALIQAFSFIHLSSQNKPPSNSAISIFSQKHNGEPFIHLVVKNGTNEYTLQMPFNPVNAFHILLHSLPIETKGQLSEAFLTFSDLIFDNDPNITFEILSKALKLKIISNSDAVKFLNNKLKDFSIKTDSPQLQQLCRALLDGIFLAPQSSNLDKNQAAKLAYSILRNEGVHAIYEQNELINELIKWLSFVDGLDMNTFRSEVYNVLSILLTRSFTNKKRPETDTRKMVATKSTEILQRLWRRNESLPDLLEQKIVSYSHSIFAALQKRPIDVKATYSFVAMLNSYGILDPETIKKYLSFCFKILKNEKSTSSERDEADQRLFKGIRIQKGDKVTDYINININIINTLLDLDDYEKAFRWIRRLHRKKMIRNSISSHLVDWSKKYVTKCINSNATDKLFRSMLELLEIYKIKDLAVWKTIFEKIDSFSKPEFKQKICSVFYGCVIANGSNDHNGTDLAGCWMKALEVAAEYPEKSLLPLVSAHRYFLDNVVNTLSNEKQPRACFQFLTSALQLIKSEECPIVEESLTAMMRDLQKTYKVFSPYISKNIPLKHEMDFRFITQLTSPNGKYLSFACTILIECLKTVEQENIDKLNNAIKKICENISHSPDKQLSEQFIKLSSNLKSSTLENLKLTPVLEALLKIKTKKATILAAKLAKEILKDCGKPGFDKINESFSKSLDNLLSRLQSCKNKKYATLLKDFLSLEALRNFIDDKMYSMLWGELIKYNFKEFNQKKEKDLSDFIRYFGTHYSKTKFNEGALNGCLEIGCKATAKLSRLNTASFEELVDDFIENRTITTKVSFFYIKTLIDELLYLKTKKQQQLIYSNKYVSRLLYGLLRRYKHKKDEIIELVDKYFYNTPPIEESFYQQHIQNNLLLLYKELSEAGILKEFPEKSYEYKLFLSQLIKCNVYIEISYIKDASSTVSIKRKREILIQWINRMVSYKTYYASYLVWITLIRKKELIKNDPKTLEKCYTPLIDSLKNIDIANLVIANQKSSLKNSFPISILTKLFTLHNNLCIDGSNISLSKVIAKLVNRQFKILYQQQEIKLFF